MKPTDLAVEKIVLHTKLVSAENVQKAKAIMAKKPGVPLLTILLKTNLINDMVAQKITAQIQKQMRLADETPAPEPASENDDFEFEDTPSAPPVEAVSNDFGDIKNMSLMSLLEYATNKGASDLHIHVNFPPIVRQDGELSHLGSSPYSAEETHNLIFEALDDTQKAKLEKDWSLDTCLEIKGVGRFRTCIIRQRLGFDGTFHIVPTNIPTFEDLGLPDNLKKLTEHPQGLVLIGGPSGSGKSSTLAAMIEHINRTRNEHIITLEDPVEFLFEPKESHISQRQVGDNTKSYSNALRAALREDPDIIMLGELRDQETASLAISASETGHLVFTTLHTTSAAKTINRVLDIFPPVERLQIRSMISQSLRGVVCQKLVPRQDGNGRQIVQEIMFNTPAVGNLIAQDRMLQLPSVMQTNAKMGMQLMDARLKELLAAGTISEEEAYHAAENAKQFKKPQMSGHA